MSLSLRRVLVVDDTPEVRSLIGRILAGQGYEVFEASSGSQAVAECRRLNGEIDLLLTDIKMPGMDGIELAGHLTKSYPAIRVLFISGECDEKGIQEHVSRRRFGFLSKPFVARKLLQAVDEVLAAAKRPGRADSSPPGSGKKTA